MFSPLCQVYRIGSHTKIPPPPSKKKITRQHVCRSGTETNSIKVLFLFLTRHVIPYHPCNTLFKSVTKRSTTCSQCNLYNEVCSIASKPSKQNLNEHFPNQPTVGQNNFNKIQNWNEKIDAIKTFLPRMQSEINNLSASVSEVGKMSTIFSNSYD